MFGLRAPELILIVVAIFLLFGATRLPQLARSIGQTRKAFKEALREGEDHEQMSAPEPAKQIGTTSASSLSDQEILAEMQRRSAAKS